MNRIKSLAEIVYPKVEQPVLNLIYALKIFFNARHSSDGARDNDSFVEYGSLKWS